MSANILTVRPAASGDDGYSNSSGAFDGSGTGARFGSNSSVALDAFFRFPNVTIPKGAGIVSASIQFQALTSLSGTTCNVNIKGDASDDATAPTNRATHAAKVRTTALTNWQPGAQTANSDYITPDFKGVIQEIVNRAGWASGNALQIFLDNNGSSATAYREEKTYDSSTTLCATLTIVYMSGGNRIYSFF